MLQTPNFTHAQSNLVINLECFDLYCFVMLLFGFRDKLKCFYLLLVCNALVLMKKWVCFDLFLNCNASYLPKISSGHVWDVSEKKTGKMYASVCICVESPRASRVMQSPFGLYAYIYTHVSFFPTDIGVSSNAPGGFGALCEAEHALRGFTKLPEPLQITRDFVHIYAQLSFSLQI